MNGAHLSLLTAISILYAYKALMPTQISSSWRRKGYQTDPRTIPLSLIFSLEKNISHT